MTQRQANALQTRLLQLYERARELQTEPLITYTVQASKATWADRLDYM